MSTMLLTIVIAIGFVAFFMLGLSLTLIFKGHNIESEIGDNPEMKKRGIKCASQQIREDEAAMRGQSLPSGDSCGGSCFSCTDKCDEEN